MTKRPKLPCPKCDGTGKIPLPEPLLETLTFVRAAKNGGVTASEAHAGLYPESIMGITAFNNRLEELRSIGLVERTRCGKTWKYSAK